MPLLPGAEPFRHDGGSVGALLCHGFTGTPASMRPWGEHLATEGVSVRIPLLPGHGTTVHDANTTTWHDWYDEIERAFVDLSGRCDQVFVMGLSMGACLSLRLAEQHGDDVAGLVVVNPSLLTKRLDRFLLPVLRHVVPTWAGIGCDIKKPGEREEAYDRVPVRAAYSLSKLWVTTRLELEQVTQPILLFRSAEDHVVEPDSSALLRAKVSSTDVREVVLENSYHVATLDNDAPTIFQGSAAFVRRLAPASA